MSQASVGAEMLALVDPELREAALAMRAAYDPGPMTVDKLAARRAWMDSLSPEPLPGVPWRLVTTSREVPGDPGEVEMLLVGEPGATRAAVLHIHGGGFTASRAHHSLPAVQALARDLGCLILSVDYRLAPETTWRGSREDTYAAWRWLCDQADGLGIDTARIALLGESAGGGHAALLALAIRDRGAPPPCFMALVYPMIDDRTGTTRAIPPHVGFFGWNGAMNRFGWASYLGGEPGGPDVPTEAVPARRNDLAGLPPAWIGVGGLDLFVGEDMRFAADLNDAGVPVELLVLPGAFHGFDSFAPQSAIARRFCDAKREALRRGLGL